MGKQAADRSMVYDYFNFGKFRIFYRIYNPENTSGKGLLFFHGKSTHSKYIENILDFKGSEDFTVFAMDYPGKGRSEGKGGILILLGISGTSQFFLLKIL